MVRYWLTRHMASTGLAIPDTLTEAQLGQWKLLGAFQRRLAPHLGRRHKTSTEADPRRTLFAGQYVSLLLLGLLNPVLKTSRALCAASHFERVQAESQGPPVRLVKAQQKRSVFIGQFGVVARSSRRGRKSPAIRSEEHTSELQ